MVNDARKNDVTNKITRCQKKSFQTLAATKENANHLHRAQNENPKFSKFGDWKGESKNWMHKFVRMQCCMQVGDELLRVIGMQQYCRNKFVRMQYCGCCDDWSFSACGVACTKSVTSCLELSAYNVACTHGLRAGWCLHVLNLVPKRPSKIIYARSHKKSETSGVNHLQP